MTSKGPTCDENFYVGGLGFFCNRIIQRVLLLALHIDLIAYHAEAVAWFVDWLLPWPFLWAS